MKACWRQFHFQSFRNGLQKQVQTCVGPYRCQPASAASQHSQPAQPASEASQPPTQRSQPAQLACPASDGPPYFSIMDSPASDGPHHGMPAIFFNKAEPRHKTQTIMNTTTIVSMALAAEKCQECGHARTHVPDIVNISGNMQKSQTKVENRKRAVEAHKR